MGKQTDVSLPLGQQAEAMARFAVLRPHLEDDVPLARVVRDAGVLSQGGGDVSCAFRSKPLERSAASSIGTCRA